MKDDNKILSGSDYNGLFVKAIHYIMLGFLYKYIIAYLIQTFAINPLMLDFSGVITKWLYMYTYSLYLFLTLPDIHFLLLRLAIFMVFKRHKTLTSHLKLKILKIFGIDGICHYHFGLEIVFICGHYFYVKEKLLKVNLQCRI